MAIDSSGSSMAGGLDINSLIQSAIAGGTVSDLFGSKDGGLGTGLILGLIASRGGLLGNNWDGNNGNNAATQDASRAAISTAVSEALVTSNQANNNAMLLLKDIQDSSADIVNAVNSASQAIQVQQLQGSNRWYAGPERCYSRNNFW